MLLANKFVVNNIFYMVKTKTVKDKHQIEIRKRNIILNRILSQIMLKMFIVNKYILEHFILNVDIVL